MSAFEDINAADFDGDDSINRTGRWYNTAGELDVGAIQGLRQRAITHLFFYGNTAASALGELAMALLDLTSLDNRQRVLQLRGPRASVIMSSIQTVRAYPVDPDNNLQQTQWLDLSNHEDRGGRRRLLYLLIKLASASQSLPPKIFLQGVDLGEARDPWRTGGCADIFRGTYCGREVVGKRLRLHNVVRGLRPPREDCEDCSGVPMTDRLWNLIESCWHRDPNSRPSMAETGHRLHARYIFKLHVYGLIHSHTPTSREHEDAYPMREDIVGTNTASGLLVEGWESSHFSKQVSVDLTADLAVIQAREETTASGGPILSQPHGRQPVLGLASTIPAMRDTTSYQYVR
jgi:hypothetical protein